MSSSEEVGEGRGWAGKEHREQCQATLVRLQLARDQQLAWAHETAVQRGQGAHRQAGAERGSARLELCDTGAHTKRIMARIFR